MAEKTLKNNGGTGMTQNEKTTALEMLLGCRSYITHIFIESNDVWGKINSIIVANETYNSFKNIDLLINALGDKLATDVDIIMQFTSEYTTSKNIADKYLDVAEGVIDMLIGSTDEEIEIESICDILKGIQTNYKKADDIESYLMVKFAYLIGCIKASIDEIDNAIFDMIV